MEAKPELNGVRMLVAEAAEMLGKHPSHLRRLWKRGVLPAPKKTGKGMPYFDDELLNVIKKVLRSGIGLNGEEIVFYRPPKERGRRTRSTRPGPSGPSASKDPYIASLKDLLVWSGIPEEQLDPDAIEAHLIAVFGDERPDLEIMFKERTKFRELRNRLRPRGE